MAEFRPDQIRNEEFGLQEALEVAKTAAPYVAIVATPVIASRLQEGREIRKEQREFRRTQTEED